jgi:hypothetical protein
LQQNAPLGQLLPILPQLPPVVKTTQDYQALPDNAPYIVPGDQRIFRKTPRTAAATTQPSAG